MLDLPPGVRGGEGDLRPLFESVEAAFYASSPGKHFLGVVNALVQGGNTPPMAGAVLYGRRKRQRRNNIR